MNNIDIPYSERFLELPSGFSLIWPFRNLPKSSGPYELFLDNNALIQGSWIDEVEDEVVMKSVVSPFHALCEQWVSNPKFRDNTAERISDFFVPFAKKGIIFEQNIATKLACILKENDAACKSQWMLSYLYVVLLYRLAFAKKGDVKPKEVLLSLKDFDVPRFSGCIMLCTLADYLKENKGVKIRGDNSPAFSYISSFISPHTSAKGENGVDVSYLRNRAGDLSMWLFIPMLIQNNFQQAGESVVVTQDKALKKLVFRCFPSVYTSNKKMAFSFDERSFEEEHSKEIWKRIINNTSEFKPHVARTDQLAKLKRLKNLVTEDAPEALVSEVDKVWREWINPGFFDEYSVNGKTN